MNAVPVLVSRLLLPLREAELRVAMVTYPGAYTDRAPALQIAVPSHGEDRKLGVVLYTVAALVESRSGSGDWDLVIEERDDAHGQIVLRLGTESNEEAARALKLLQDVVRSVRARIGD